MTTAFRVKVLAVAVHLTAFGALATSPAWAQSPAEQRGRSFVRTNCSTCHSVEKHGASPLAIAPPFRNLHLRYPVENLAEALAEGIRTGHPSMPEFQLDPGQIHDVIAYLKSLER
ncbi:MAG: cytochrome c [Xanthobacteraceae bacterium]|nr:cytochrome c [Xanthobacteraceae bacterium]